MSAPKGTRGARPDHRRLVDLEPHAVAQPVREALPEARLASTTPRAMPSMSRASAPAPVGGRAGRLGLLDELRGGPPASGRGRVRRRTCASCRRGSRRPGRPQSMTRGRRSASGASTGLVVRDAECGPDADDGVEGTVLGAQLAEQLLETAGDGHLGDADPHLAASAPPAPRRVIAQAVGERRDLLVVLDRRGLLDQRRRYDGLAHALAARGAGRRRVRLGLDASRRPEPAIGSRRRRAVSRSMTSAGPGASPAAWST